MGKQFRINLSQLQASSCQSVCQNLEDSIDGINDAVSGAASLGSMKGMGATHVRAYATEVVAPMLRAAMMLTVGVNRDVQQLPKRYVAQVDSKSHDEDELEQEIQDIQREIQMMDELTKMIGKIDQGAADKLKNSTKGVRSDEEARLRKLKRILRDFRRYDRESGGLFSDLDALREAFDTATREIKSCTIQSGSKIGFKMPKDMEWAHYVNKKWDQQKKKEHVKIPAPSDKVTNFLSDLDSLMVGGMKDVANSGKILKARELYRYSSTVGKLADWGQYLMSAMNFTSDYRKNKDVGVSLMKDVAGVALGVGAGAVVGFFGAPEIGVAFASVGACDFYNLLYDHSKIFRHTMNDIGHGIDCVGRSIEKGHREIEHGMDKGDRIIEHAHVGKLPENSMPGPNGYSTTPSF